LARHAGRPNRNARPTAPGAQPALARAMTALQAGRFDEAAAVCTELLARTPRDSKALHLFGVALLKAGRTAEAADALERAARIEPTNAELYANLGAAQRAAGHPAKAVASLKRAIALRPAFAPARFNLGNALGDLGRHEEAAAAYRDTLALDSGHAGARNNLGLALVALGRSDEAEAMFRSSLATHPGQRDANLSLARILRRRGDLAGALACLDAACAAAPGDPGSQSERGVVLVELDRAAEGVAALEQAVAVAPDQPDFRINLGSALCTLGDAAAALPHFERADALAPGNAETLANLGHALKQLGRSHDAVGTYDRALAIDDGNREARFGRAFCRLLDGDFANAWPDYRARESMANAGPELWRAPLPHDLTTRRVLVQHDQGIGDEIFFLRFMPALAARGAEVLYRPDPRLGPMIARSGIAVVEDSAAAGRCDYTVSVGDLPYILGSTAPPPSIALTPLAGRVADAEARLAAFGPPPYVGVTWRAGTRNTKNVLYKESPAARLAASLGGIDARVVVLQRQPKPGETADFAGALGRPVLDLSVLNDDLEAMLALVGLLDDQICVSNTNVHLAAAHGRTCRILLPHPPEFRWMAAGTESPWFPGMHIYRQAPDGGWDTAFAALGRDLVAAFAPRLT